MDKRRFNIENPDDIDELNRLVFDEIEEGKAVVHENLDESDNEDFVEERLIDSDTDYEVSDEDDDDHDVVYYTGKSIHICHSKKK